MTINNALRNLEYRLDGLKNKNKSYESITWFCERFAHDFVYLASPYSSPWDQLKKNRFKEISLIAAYLYRQLIKLNTVIYSPICHGVPMAVVDKNLQGDYEYWRKFDEAFMLKSTKLMVVCMGGWKKSKGVRAEIDFAKQIDLPIYYCFTKNRSMFITNKDSDLVGFNLG